MDSPRSPAAPPPVAYRVPFELERRPRHGSLRLRNVSAEALDGVRLHLDGPGVMAASLPQRLPPGSALDVRVLGDDLAVETLLVVRWFRPDGVEYLWQVSF